MRVTIITGLSGSGKTTSIKALEDMGFYCVDNLPVALLPKFAELCDESPEVSRVGIGMDARGGDFLKGFSLVMAALRKAGHDVEIVFLESSDAVLVSRFSETRRAHPLAHGGRVLDGVAKERELLAPLKGEAGKVIDTSGLNVHQLKRVISDYVGGLAPARRMAINLISFGFKYGPLYEADMVMDVRFLPNPNFVEEMKALTGDDPAVSDYVLKSETGAGFMDRFASLIAFLIPCYAQEGKSYLTIGIGCTGGRHRSVAVVNRIKRDLAAGEYDLSVLHRDRDRPS